jgi:hypothetical protein
MYWNFFSRITRVFIERYAEKQRLIYLGPNGGYSYTWVFDNIFLNIHFIAGFNASLNINTTQRFFTPALLPKMALGYHSKTSPADFQGSTKDHGPALYHKISLPRSFTNPVSFRISA